MRTVGRPALDLEVLLPEDVAAAEDLLRPTREVPQLKHIKDTHHNLARLLASGLRIGEAAIQAGFSGARVSSLMADPAFRELVAGYRARCDEIHEEVYRGARQMAANTTTVLIRMVTDAVEIADQTDNVGPDNKPIIPLGRMESLINTLGQSTVLPKQSVTMQIDGNSLADRMAAADARLQQRESLLPGASLVEALPPSPTEGEGS
jgi:hypothetical protein